MRALRTSWVHRACAALVCLGALGCGESSSSNGDDDASGGMGDTTSSGGRTSTGGSGSGRGGVSTGGSAGEDAGEGGAGAGGSAGSANGGEAGTSNGGNAGGLGGAGQAGMGGAGGGGTCGALPDGVVSDPPTRLTNIGRAGGGAFDGLEVTHSHFYIDPDAEPANTWTWLAVVRSSRSDLVCDLAVEGNFLNPSSEPIQIVAAVAAPVYRLTSASSVFRCIPPGEIGVASGAALDGPPQVMPDSVTEIQYQVRGTPGTNYVPGDWVSISNVDVVPADMGNTVRGTFTNGTSQMAWWEANVYPMNCRGMPLVQFILRDSRVQLAPGTTWDFETPVYAADFDDAYVFVRHARAQ